MINLDNPQEFTSLDPKDVYGSTGMLADQCTQIWEDAKKVNYPDDYKNVENIVIAGMGGSAYGGHVVKALFKNELKVPLYVNSDYHLPGFANEKTLVILTSYSGSTEESLSNARDAQKNGCKITALTSGGKLGEFLKSNNLPGLVFNSPYNPSNQPRLGTGYVILGTIALLKQLGFLDIPDETVANAIALLKNEHDTIKQKAKEIARQLQGSIPVIFAAEFLEGNAHIMRNQFNETSKSFSTFSDLPELNHHLLEGLKNPEDKKLKTFILESSLYSDVLKKRVTLTKDVVSKNNIDHIGYDAAGTDKLSQMLNVLAIGGYITVYLAFLYGLDPSLIPWVDYFKEQLSKK